MHLVLWHSRLTEDVKGVEAQLNKRMTDERELETAISNRFKLITVISAEKHKHTALMPQNWRPAQGMARVSSCHRTQREVSRSFTVFAFSPWDLSRSNCMSSNSIFKLSSCHSHCKAVGHRNTTRITSKVCSISLPMNRSLLRFTSVVSYNIKSSDEWKQLFLYSGSISSFLHFT